LYSNLKERSLKNKISTDFNLNSEYFDNFLHAITEIRNICAHYGRLWNRKFPAKIKILKNTENGWLKNIPEDKDCNKIYLYLSYIKFVTDYLDINNNFAVDLKELIQKNELIDLNSMGFTNDWKEEELWK
jgi:abortive infection bacteriophage resistance protein